MKTNTKLVLGILTAVLVIGFIVVWDLVIKENIESEEVLVIRPGVIIHPYDVIKETDLQVEKRNRATFIEGFLTPDQKGSVVGLQAKQLLVGNQLLSARYIDLEDFEPDPKKGEAVRPIPEDWIYAIPSTVRRKDKIDIYLVKKGTTDEPEVETKESSYNPSYVGMSPEQEQALEKQEFELLEEDEAYSEEADDTAKSDITNELAGDEKDIQNFIGDRESWLKKKGLTEKEWEELVQHSKIPVLVNVPVSYAKDGAGNEILNGPDEGAKQKPERLTATGAIVNLELKLNEDEHRLLIGYIKNGYQLYITYN